MFETIQEVIKPFVDVKSLILYSLGFITFFVTLIDNIFNPSEKIKSLSTKQKVHKYLFDFLYTSISIVIGISISILSEFSQSTTCLIVITMGLSGSMIIRKVLSKQDEISEAIVDKIGSKLGEAVDNISISETKNEPTEVSSNE